MRSDGDRPTACRASAVCHFQRRGNPALSPKSRRIPLVRADLGQQADRGVAGLTNLGPDRVMKKKLGKRLRGPLPGHATEMDPESWRTKWLTEALAKRRRRRSKS